MNRGREEQGRIGNNVTNSVGESKQQDKKLWMNRGREEQGRIGNNVTNSVRESKQQDK